MLLRTITIALVALIGPALAENGHSPYVDMQGRGIKALSSDETRGLLGGEGMSLSLAAELNGYPGPRHVIELADRLDLSPEQRQRAAALEAEMKSAAVSLGRTVLELEGELDRAFLAGGVDRATIDRLTAEIAAKRGSLRAVHLQAHLAMAQALRPEQRTRYMVLRGYSGGAAGAPHQHRRHH